MEIIGDSKIRVGLGEVVTATSDSAKLSIDTGSTLSASKSASAETVTIVAPRTPGRVRLHVQADEDGHITLRSAMATIVRKVLRGVNIFDIISEPRPDEWYCENDDGDPPHPVSKGDTKCSYCGGKVLHGTP